MKKKNPSDKNRIGAAALKLIAAKGWNKTDLPSIAKASKTSLTRVQKICPDMYQLAALLVQYVTDETARNIGKIDADQSPHDRLFEVLMARLDVLQKNRQAFLAIMLAIPRDYRLATSLISAQMQAMQALLKLTELGNGGYRDTLSTAGLMVVYLAALLVWKRDETIDMSRTMAVCDKLLKRACKAAEILFR
jgi:AcrR family transcriptional regulator